MGSHIYDADIRELSEDVRSLVEHDAFLFQKYVSYWILRLDLLTPSKMIRFVDSQFYPVCLRHQCLIASIYGMNTDELPFAHSSLSFMVVAGILMAFLILPMIYFRWKKWI